MMNKLIGTLGLFLVLSIPAWALDDAGNQRLAAIQQRWAEIQYQVMEQQRADEFEKLAAQSSAFLTASEATARKGGGRRIAGLIVHPCLQQLAIRTALLPRRAATRSPRDPGDGLSAAEAAAGGVVA